MATLWFSCAGEGRGHATRLRTVVEALRGEHCIRLFAPGVAFEFLSDAYGTAMLDGRGDVTVTRIPGLMFRYRNGRVSKPGTLWDAGGYLRRLNRLVTALRREMDAGRPDLVISDFEPALPRAAQRAGVPTLSLDHQHFMLISDLAELPLWLRLHVWAMVPVVAAYCPKPVETVASSFYFPPLRRGLKNVTQIGTLLRPAVRDANTCDAGHIVAYLRKFGDPHVLQTLAACGRPVRVYGLGERPTEAALQFCSVSEDAFLADLASASAVVTNAGNQLVGEALYLNKPVLAIPEEGQAEQWINAHFLRAGGGGDWVRLRDFNAATLGAFLADLDRFRGRVDRSRLCGNDQALAAIRRHLPAAALDRGHTAPQTQEVGV